MKISSVRIGQKIKRGKFIGLVIDRVPEDRSSGFTLVEWPSKVIETIFWDFDADEVEVVE